MGNQVTRESGGRVPGYQDTRKKEDEKIFNPMPGCPDICYLTT